MNFYCIYILGRKLKECLSQIFLKVPLLIKKANYELLFKVCIKKIMWNFVFISLTQVSANSINEPFTSKKEFSHLASVWDGQIISLDMLSWRAEVILCIASVILTCLFIYLEFICHNFGVWDKWKLSTDAESKNIGNILIYSKYWWYNNWWSFSEDVCEKTT